MAQRMPPPGRGKGPSLMVAIGVPKGGRTGPPGKEGGDPPLEAASEGSEGSDQKMSPEEALVVRSDHHCKDCQNWNTQDGSCSKVNGYFDPEDSCMRYFTPMKEGSEPDEGGEGDPDQAMEAQEAGNRAS